MACLVAGTASPKSCVMVFTGSESRLIDFLVCWKSTPVALVRSVNQRDELIQPIRLQQFGTGVDQTRSGPGCGRSMASTSLCASFGTSVRVLLPQLLSVPGHASDALSRASAFFHAAAFPTILWAWWEGLSRSRAGRGPSRRFSLACVFLVRDASLRDASTVTKAQNEGKQPFTPKGVFPPDSKRRAL
jgi:hypothetical protein